MIPCRSCFATAVPRTPEVRLKIAEAIRAFMAHENDEPLPGWCTSLAPLRRGLGETALALQELKRECDPRLRSHVLKYNPDQPRVPAGNPDGGQWTNADASGASGVSNENGNRQNSEPRNVVDDGSGNATNDNVRPEQICRQAYADGLAGVRRNPSLNPAEYLKGDTSSHLHLNFV